MRWFLAIALLLPVSAAGQTCLGASDRRQYPIQLGGGLSHSAAHTRVEAGAGAGGAQLFVNGAFGYDEAHRIDIDITALIGRVGFEQVLPARLHVCPVLDGSVARIGGTYLGADDLQQWTGGAGVFLGLDRATFVPIVGVRLLTARYTGSAAGVKSRDSVTFGLLQAGVGIRPASRLAIIPSAEWELGIDGDTAYLLAVSIGLGR